MTRSRSVAARPSPHLPVAAALDCQSCGACCAPARSDALYVGLRRGDLARLSPAWAEKHVAQNALLTKLDPVGRCVCVGLRGTIGERVSCAIYARRPTECRLLVAGSPDCLDARRQAGLPLPT